MPQNFTRLAIILPIISAEAKSSSMKILIADDDPHSLRLLRLLLLKEGYEVLTASNGTEALAILESKDSPRLVVLDWMMPDIDGLSICKRIREAENEEEYRYIVLLTARSDMDDLVTGMNAGADDYIVKPFNESELKVRLRAGKRILDLHKQLLERTQTVQDFVYAFSHDMRTPLIAINMTMSQAIEGIFGDLPGDYINILRKSKRSIQELMNMADTLLMVARYEYNEKALENNSIDLNQTARACAEELEPISTSKGIKVQVQMPESRPVIGGDSQSLRRLFINLMDNAIKFSPEGGSIKVCFELRDSSIISRVIDSGTGIPFEEQSTLFQRFSSDKKRRKGSGTGLGLYLCKRIAEDHGGSLHYELSPKTGSCFVLELPRISN
ncbi:MAG: response regulator [Candidatus Obscuribacterales bacterium]|nr:response regulator [Candidatus Obscuribacterales bacterium]